MTSTLHPARVPDDDLLRFARAVTRHFYEGEEDADVQPLADVAAEDFRAWWVLDDDRVVANLGVFETDLSLPGGARLPTAAVTTVGVAQTMRRRGLLRAMMRACLDEARDRGEPLAALFASESEIYGRFGFGIAARHVAYRTIRWRVRFRDPVDVRLVRETMPEEALRVWPAIHDRMRDQRSGSVAPTTAAWRLGVLVDPPGWRDGATTRRLVEVPGRGYARYRIKDGDAGDGPDATVLLSELVATDPEAEAALWQHVCDLDLTARTRTWLRPVDDALPHLVTDPLALGASTGPPLYVRVLDLPRILTARTYDRSGSATLQVVDPDGYVDGRWSLEAGPDGASCEPATAEPDLVVPVETVACLLFGGVPATALLAARRLEERRPGAAADLDRLLATDRAPWTSAEF